MIVVDTNVLVRAVKPNDGTGAAAARALRIVTEAPDGVVIPAQALYEFWTVAARAAEANGLAMSVAEAPWHLDTMRANFTILVESESSLRLWRDLVVNNSITGKGAHDARIAAVMLTHGITSIVTFDPSVFRRIPGLTVIDPASLPLAP